MLFEQMAESRNRAFVRRLRDPRINARKRAIQRHVMQRFFHGRARQTAELLQQINPQHQFWCERRPAGLALRRVLRHPGHQRQLGNYSIHLVQKYPLAGLIRRQIKARMAKTLLFNQSISSRRG